MTACPDCVEYHRLLRDWQTKAVRAYGGGGERVQNYALHTLTDDEVITKLEARKQ